MKQKITKLLLASTTILAVAGSANAAVVSTTGNAKTGSSAGWNPAEVPVSGSDLIITGDHIVTQDTAAFEFTTITVNGDGDLVAQEDTKVTDAVTIADAKTFTVTAGVGRAVTFKSTIDGGASDGSADLEISSAIVEGVVGGTKKLQNIEAGANGDVTFKQAITATNFEVQGNKVTVENTLTARTTVTAGELVMSGADAKLADNATVAAGGEMTVTGVATGFGADKTIALGGAASTLTVTMDTEASSFDSAVTAATAGEGAVKVTKGTVSKAIATDANKVKSVEAGADGDTTFSGDVNTLGFEVKGNVVTVNGKMEGLTSDLKLADGSTLALGSEASVETTAGLAGTDTTKLKFTVTRDAGTKDIKTGSLKLGTAVDLKADSYQNMEFDTSAVVFKDGESFTALKGTGAGPTLAGNTKTAKFGEVTYTSNNTDVYSANTATTFTATADSNDVKFTANVTDLNEFVKDEATASGAVIDYAKNFIAAQDNFTAGSTASTVASQLQHLTADKAVDALRTSAGDMNTNAGAKLAAKQNFSAMSARVASIAAGGDDVEIGAWAKFAYETATQKKRKNEDGYKAKSWGGTMGYDMRFDNDSVLGATIGFGDSEVKHKDGAAGDKTKAKSWNLGMYYSHNLAKNFFMSEAVQLGFSKFKTTHSGAKANFDGMNIGVSALVGYNHELNAGTTLTPMVSGAWERLSQDSYKNSVDVNFAKKHVDSFEVSAGAKLSHNTERNGMSFTPEAHAFVNYDVLGKAETVKTKIDGMSSYIAAKAAKPAKLSYNVGMSLTAKSAGMEYSAGYDADLKNKYVGHRGFVKVRMSF